MLGKSVGQLFNSFLPVGEDHALGNCHVLVELEKGSELLAVLLKGNVELLDTFQSQLLVLDQDLDGGLHEVVGHFHNFRWHCGRKEADLDVCR